MKLFARKPVEPTAEDLRRKAYLRPGTELSRIESFGRETILLKRCKIESIEDGLVVLVSLETPERLVLTVEEFDRLAVFLLTPEPGR